jgi:hypothetical protein
VIACGPGARRGPLTEAAFLYWYDLKIAAPTTLKDMVAENAHSRNYVRVFRGPLALVALRRRDRVRFRCRSLGSMHCNSPYALGGSATLFVTDKKSKKDSAVIKPLYYVCVCRERESGRSNCYFYRGTGFIRRRQGANTKRPATEKRTSSMRADEAERRVIPRRPAASMIILFSERAICRF